MLQMFETTSESHLSSARLIALREKMEDAGIDWLLVPHADAHQNEYLPERAERLAWISGFTGSAGSAIIGRQQAILIVDGRYTLQAQDQTDPDAFTVVKLADFTPKSWLEAHLEAGDRLGLDIWTSTLKQAETYRKVTDQTESALVPLQDNLIDSVWMEQPDLPATQVSIQDIAYAGKHANEKIDDIQNMLSQKAAPAVLLTDPTSICWLMNIRGNDIPKTPLTLAWAIVPAQGKVQLFITRSKLNIEVQAYLTQMADIHPYREVVHMVQSHLSAGNALMVDAGKTALAFAPENENHNALLVEADDPIVLPRALKNDTEISGAFAAHKRDGVAMVRFLAWLDLQAPGSVDEITCAKQLEELRRETADATDETLQDIAFDTISATGPNAALPHYRVTTDTNRTLQAGDLYLVDSGAQYRDGTTDITRTIAISKPSEEQRDRFTRVLQGHIAVQSARFPEGTKGITLDAYARRALWQGGFDFAHGTGHGVGSFLSVHEGPQNISPRGQVAFKPGMITSNEPGYYKEGAFGIRIENLELCRPSSMVDGGDVSMLHFETLTLCPIDRRLIVTEMLTETEIHWVNDYHARVALEIGPLLEDNETRNWLEAATAPLIP